MSAGSRIGATGLQTGQADTRYLLLDQTTPQSILSGAPIFDAGLISNGNVGIGIASPSDRLHVAGDIRVTGAYKDSANSAGASGYLLASTGTGTAWTALSGLSVGNADTLDSLDSTQFLRSDASDSYTSGTLTFDAATTLDVNGGLSIADTDIALDGASTNLTATGNFSVNTDDIFVEKTTGNIGVGTASPRVKLDVINSYSGTNPLSVDRVFSVTNDSATSTNAIMAIVSGNAAVAGINFGDKEDQDAGAVYYYHATNALSFRTNGNATDRMLIDSAGNVGIGTTAPTNILDIVGSTVRHTSSSTAYNDIFSSGASDAILRFGASSNPTWSIGNDATNNDLVVAQTFNLDSSQKFIIKSTTGYVGIGTTAPGANLEVVRNEDISTSGQLKIASRLKLNDNVGGTIQANMGVGLAFNTGNQKAGNADMAAIYGQNPTVGDITNGALTFYTLGSNTLAEKMRISSTGNVGIGTTSPGAKLQINTGADATIGQIIRGNASQTANLTEWQNSSGGVLAVVTATGNVGIGTTSPSYKLDILDTSNSYALRAIHSTTNINSTRDTFALKALTSGDMVDGFGPNFAFRIEDSAGVDRQIAAISGVRSGADSSGALNFTTFQAGSGTVKMSIRPDGNVGIGTTAPAQKFEVYDGNAQITVNSTAIVGNYGGNLTLFNRNATDNSGSSLLFQAYDSSGTDPDTGAVIAGVNVTRGTGLTTDLIFGTSNNASNPTEYMRLTSVGNLGIGTTAPAAKLQVNGAASAITAIFRANATTPGDIIIGENSSGTDLFKFDSTGTLSILTPSPTALTIGAGTAGVDYQIKVDGETNDLTLTYMEDEDRLDTTADLQFTNDSDGVILTDRTTATKYRLYVDGGTLTIESV